LLGFVDGADQETDPNRQELDLGERDLDVARDDQPFIEDSIEHVHETRRGSSVILR
jgi:hypothetical protein